MINSRGMPIVGFATEAVSRYFLSPIFAILFIMEITGISANEKLPAVPHNPMQGSDVQTFRLTGHANLATGCIPLHLRLDC